MKRAALFLLLMSSLLMLGCALSSSHRFASPARNWTTRSGQLAYHGRKRNVIGEVLVRYSPAGDFELTFSKGPVTLLLERTDAEFGRVEGPLVGLPWSGHLTEAPARVRSWFKLREEVLRNPQTKMARVSDEGETLTLRF